MKWSVKMKNYRQIFNRAVVGFALAAGLAGCGVTYSEGDRAGSVIKISYKGLLCKSWEGQLATDGFVSATDEKGNRSSSNVFEFSVTDPAIVKKLQEAQESGARVKLHYDQALVNNPCTSSTDYYITSVTPVAGKQVKTLMPN